MEIYCGWKISIKEHKRKEKQLSWPLSSRKILSWVQQSDVGKENSCGSITNKKSRTYCTSEQSHLPSQTGHMSFGSGSLRERIGSRSGVDQERIGSGSPLYSEPLIGSERSHDFGRGSAPDPLLIHSLF